MAPGELVRGAADRDRELDGADRADVEGASLTGAPTWAPAPRHQHGDGLARPVGVARRGRGNDVGIGQIVRVVGGIVDEAMRRHLRRRGERREHGADDPNGDPCGPTPGGRRPPARRPPPDHGRHLRRVLRSASRSPPPRPHAPPVPNMILPHTATPFPPARVAHPTPKFVEPVETNPEVTAPFALTPAPSTMRTLSSVTPLQTEALPTGTTPRAPLVRGVGHSERRGHCEVRFDIPTRATN